jgi:cytochrome c oxidase subunit 3
VIGGLVLMLAVLGVSVGRTSRAPLHETVTVSEYYWHFVDAVWVAMFATIYLIR